MQGNQMGRSEIPALKSTMSAREVAKHLVESCASLTEFDSYMFGSSIRGFGNDFDILIIIFSTTSIEKLKSEIAIAGAELPLDVLYMLPEEECETEFIERQGCVSLTQLAKLAKLDH